MTKLVIKPGDLSSVLLHLCKVGKERANCTVLSFTSIHRQGHTLTQSNILKNKTQNYALYHWDGGGFELSSDSLESLTTTHLF